MSESYTYSSKQFKVIIKKIANLYTFALINQDTNEFFQSQETEFKRISSQTLNAAFNEKVKNITNQIIYEDQSHIKIIIKVSLDFLPQFCQTILLKKTQKGQKQLQKLHYLELQNQIKVVRDELEWLVDTSTNKKIIFMQKPMQNINGTENIIWKLNLQKGDYLVQSCGCGTGIHQQNYNQEYDYNDGGYYGSIPAFNTKSNFLFQVNLNKDLIYSINFKPFDYSNYEYPYSFNFIMHLEKESQMSVSVKDLNQASGTLNNNKLILQTIKRQKQ